MSAIANILESTANELERQLVTANVLKESLIDSGIPLESKHMDNFIRVMLVGLAVLAGCGKHDDGESIAKHAGSKVGETLTDFAAGVGEGVDKQMTVDVELSDAFAEQGISKTIAKLTGTQNPNVRGIAVYLIATKPFTSKLMARALAKDGQEVGRSIVAVEFTTDEAKYVTFTFDREMDTQLVDKYMLDVKK